EAAAAFGAARVLLERLVTQPRHVELQVLGDEHGHVLHLLERECSIQRRHQKLLEEAPSPALDEALRARMGAAAVTAAAEVGYTGAGTVEFLLEGSTLASDEPRFYFLEMNTRLQVEHPVTELITGLDLVQLQLEVAAGAELPLTQDDVRADGHAIEVRLYAEDPVEHLPQTGTITGIDVPTGTDVRWDTGIEVGSDVTRHYDPMLAKLIVHAPDRAAACARLAEVLDATSVRGVVTNLALLRAIVEVEAFRTGALDTGFLPTHLGDWHPPGPSDADLRAAVRLLVAEVRDRATSPVSSRGTGPGDGPWATLGPRRLVGGGGWPVTLRHGEVTRTLRVRRDAAGDHAELDGEVAPLPDAVAGEVVTTAGTTTVWLHGQAGTVALEHVAATRHRDVAAPTGRAALTAPMPGAVLAVEVAGGEAVRAGQTLVVVEAMKMEHPVVAPADGTIGAVHVRVGDTVGAGTVLIDLDADADVEPAP
ncbi:MAG: acetyl/propionyl-CoA carboxylase subunit alpha, partial [Nitriliruptoraceae bacterium]|nr:acetyl/propionyl-CoA carboxylase subunit alpha [Nitriliruptoraceae bacterium]